MRAFLPTQSTFWVDSSGLAVAQSMTVWMPTRVAGRDEGSPRSACTVVAPQSRKKSAGFCRGRTMQRTCIRLLIQEGHLRWSQKSLHGVMTWSM